jgi:hypothetical protein
MAVASNNFKRLTLSLHSDEYEALRFVAFKRKSSIAGVVRDMVKELIEEEEDIRDGLKALEEKGDTLDWASFKREHLGL